MYRCVRACKSVARFLQDIRSEADRASAWVDTQVQRRPPCLAPSTRTCAMKLISAGIYIKHVPRITTLDAPTTWLSPSELQPACTRPRMHPRYNLFDCLHANLLMSLVISFFILKQNDYFCWPFHNPLLNVRIHQVRYKLNTWIIK